MSIEKEDSIFSMFSMTSDSMIHLPVTLCQQCNECQVNFIAKLILVQKINNSKLQENDEYSIYNIKTNTETEKYI